MTKGKIKAMQKAILGMLLMALALGGELAFFLFHRLELVGSGEMRYFFRDSKAGSLGYFLSAGLRFTL